MQDEMNQERPMPDHDVWPAFTVPWDDNTSGPTDMSHLLDKPAGAKGFIQVVDGHLATGDGKRWRIWGQNLTGNSPLPNREMAPIIARRLAKFGINCIRLHHCDHRWPKGFLKRASDGKPAPDIIVDGVAGRDEESTRALDPEAMARLDWFVACCKRNGVYIDLNLNVSRPFSVADGVKQVDWIGFGKGMTYFDEQLIFLQKEYAAQLLNHVNPFTGVRYAEEPAIAIIELINENILIRMWIAGMLRGEQTAPAGSWGDIPSSYAKDLDKRWNDWLAGKYDSRETLSTAWDSDLEDYEDPRQGSVRRLVPEDFEAASDQRFRDEATFYLDMEKDYFADMESYLHGEVGARQLILGTSDWNHRWSGFPSLETNAELDLIDGHIYWQHPRFPAVHWSRTDWYISNTPMVDAANHSAPGILSRSRVLGKPYIVSELNHPFPNDYSSEFIPIMAAYGLLQDWDGLFWFAYGGGTEEQWKDGAIRSFFSMANDPVKMTETAIGALMFLRGDVQAANELVDRQMTHEWKLESLRVEMPDDEHPYWLPWLPGRLALQHGTAITDFNAESTLPAEGEVSLAGGRIVSDTGELVWEENPENGGVLIDTARYQAVIGHAGKRSTRNLTVDLSTPFASIQITSLDEKPIAGTEQLLLVAAARVANTGMRWKDNTRHSIGDEWGTAPTRIEPVQATLTLSGLGNANSLTIEPLDDYGQPTAPSHSLPIRQGKVILELPTEYSTLWYSLRIDR